MGYLSKFENDLFMSYRRAANETHDKWIDVFSEALRSSLVELLGSDVSIWRDANRLATGDVWRAELQTAVDKAGIFLAVVSRSYFQSDECRKELDRFLWRMKETSPPSRKIVPVFKQPLNPETPPPAELSGIQDHKFFHWQQGSQHWRELGPNGNDAEEREFWASLGRLAQDIMIALEELEGAARKAVRGKVFLARTCPELDQDRERVRADLQLRNFDVVPRNEYLWNTAEHLDRIDADLADVQLCVHLVSVQASIETESAARSRLQLVKAHEAMKAKGRLAPLVWIQPSERVDPSAAELLRTIEGELANEGLEYWRGGLEDLKTQIYDKLSAAAPERGAGAAGEIALLVEEGDLEEIGPLRAMLVDGFGLDPKLIKFIGPLPKDAERMKRTLASCRRCIVFWSRQGEEWLDDVVSRPELAASLGRSTLCIELSGARTAEKKGFVTPKATVVDATQGAGDTAAAFQDFFALSVP